MIHKLLAGVFAAAILFSAPPSAEAHSRFTRGPVRTVNSFRRDVRQIQRQSTRTFNQFDRSFSRTVRRSPVHYAPRSSAVYLGSPRGGVYFRF